MMSHENFVQVKFGIDEIYFHKGFTPCMLEKFHQRAELSLDGEDKIVLKFATLDIILIFNKRLPSQSLIYRFIEFLDQYADKEDFIKFNTLQDEEELFSSIKTKKFVLITPKMLLKETYLPQK